MCRPGRYLCVLLDNVQLLLGDILLLGADQDLGTVGRTVPGSGGFANPGQHAGIGMLGGGEGDAERTNPSGPAARGVRGGWE